MEFVGRVLLLLLVGNDLEDGEQDVSALLLHLPSEEELRKVPGNLMIKKKL